MGVTRYAPAAGEGRGGKDAVSATARSPAAGGSNRPVLVLIVVDQLAAWIADERWPTPPADGGFNCLRREGLYVRELHYSHAATDTAPGHAALFSGAPPHDSGIVANETLAPDTVAPISFLADPAARELAPGAAGGGEARTGSSLRALRVETFGCSARAAPMAVVTCWRSSGGGRIAVSPRDCSHSSRHHPFV